MKKSMLDELPPVMIWVLSAMCATIIILVTAMWWWSLGQTITLTRSVVADSISIGSVAVGVGTMFGIVIQLWPSVAWILMVRFVGESWVKWIRFSAVASTLIDIGTNVAQGMVDNPPRLDGDPVAIVIRVMLWLVIYVGISWGEELVMGLSGVLMDLLARVFPSAPTWMKWGKALQQAAVVGATAGYSQQPQQQQKPQQNNQQNWQGQKKG